MALYMLSPDPDVVVMRLEEPPPNLQMWITRESRFWPDYEAWLAEGNEPDPWTPVVFPRSSDVD